MSHNRPPSANIRKRPKKQMMLFSGRANPGLAQEVAAQLGTELVPTSAYDFANGEIYVRFEESVRGSDAFVRLAVAGAPDLAARVDPGAMPGRGESWRVRLHGRSATFSAGAP